MGCSFCTWLALRPTAWCQRRWAGKTASLPNSSADQQTEMETGPPKSKTQEKCCDEGQGQCISAVVGITTSGEPACLPKFNISTGLKGLRGANGPLCALYTKQPCLPLGNGKSQPRVTTPLRKFNIVEEETEMNQNNNNNKSIKEKKTILKWYFSLGFLELLRQHLKALTTCFLSGTLELQKVSLWYYNCFASQLWWWKHKPTRMIKLY